ncbi:hypothetical protein MMC12_002505 [Toensbergia leucococca]|nr:hypothetical protein [Toensbergia leucococca]
MDPTSSKALESALQYLQSHESPHIPSPPQCQKRASVALVLRIRPRSSHKATYDQKKCGAATNSFLERLHNFFSQPWVQQGDPEVLFIRRAARTGDRWTSHVALPGGKSEPDDSDDRATAARETIEETGLDVDTDHCLYVGNLPERIVTTAWGEVPYVNVQLDKNQILDANQPRLMVLCPFVYLMMRDDVPSLNLQSSEVDSSHWVPISVLLSPALRTHERADVSDRLAAQGGQSTRFFLRATLGHMLFAAVELSPSESVYCNLSKDPNSNNQRPTPTTGVPGKILAWWSARSASGGTRLLLWGLTLGIMTDFLELLPPHDAPNLWTWPTFSHWDVRFILWLMTYSFRMRKMRLVVLDNQAESFKADPGDETSQSSEVTWTEFSTQLRKGSPASTIGQMLDGYYVFVRKAIFLALFLRIGLGSMLAAVLYRTYQRRLYNPRSRL